MEKSTKHGIIFTAIAVVILLLLFAGYNYNKKPDDKDTAAAQPMPVSSPLSPVPTIVHAMTNALNVTPLNNPVNGTANNNAGATVAAATAPVTPPTVVPAIIPTVTPTPPVSVPLTSTIPVKVSTAYTNDTQAVTWINNWVDSMKNASPANATIANAISSYNSIKGTHYTVS